MKFDKSLQTLTFFLDGGDCEAILEFFDVQSMYISKTSTTLYNYTIEENTELQESVEIEIKNKKYRVNFNYVIVLLDDIEIFLMARELRFNKLYASIPYFKEKAYNELSNENVKSRKKLKQKEFSNIKLELFGIVFSRAEIIYTCLGDNKMFDMVDVSTALFINNFSEYGNQNKVTLNKDERLINVKIIRNNKLFIGKVKKIYLGSQVFSADML